MDTSAVWCGLWLGTLALWLVRERWQAALLAQIRKQLSDTERELWHALRRVGYFERMAKEWRQGVRVRVIGRDCE